MATWDGSYQGPEDANYHYYPFPNYNLHPNVNPNTWTYYPPTTENVYPSNNQHLYTSNTPINYSANQNQMETYNNTTTAPYVSSVPQEHTHFGPSHYQNHQEMQPYNNYSKGSYHNEMYNNETKIFYNRNIQPLRQTGENQRDVKPETLNQQKSPSRESSFSTQSQKLPRNASSYRQSRSYAGSNRLNYENFDSSDYESLIFAANAEAGISGDNNGNKDKNWEQRQYDAQSSMLTTERGVNSLGQDFRNGYGSNDRYGDKFRAGNKGRFNNWSKEKQFNKMGNKSGNGRKYGGREDENQLTNWRKDNNGGVVKRSMISKRSNNSISGNKAMDMDDDASQRERLTEQLNKGILECLVCCDHIKQMDAIWSCKNCYHVLHIKCIKKWALSSKDESGAWRCPACRNQLNETPMEYFCFCGKVKNPDWNRQDDAHTCGEVCGRNRLDPNCIHKCTLLCHPGGCPKCCVVVTKNCNCGKMSQMVKCSTETSLLCEATCEKLLNCEKHYCQKKCHEAACDVCQEKVKQECYCGKYSREVPCDKDTQSQYECGETCGKLLDCGNHKCEKICHPGACDMCTLKPEIVTHCCCSQTPLEKPRSSCLDPIPTCDKICSKPLKCGQPSAPHKCQSKCHNGDCPECNLTTMVRCRCGNMDKEIPCKELTTKADDARCEKRCTKKRSCRKHKCNQLCCIDIEHICPIICSKTLSCGKHKCEQTCHIARCQPCWRSSFDELYCECGASVIYPPVPCGTRRPACSQPCSRQHSCDHEVFHNCHSETSCPPCSVLTRKWCHGGHELRNAVPCHVKELSCGLQCNKELSCGRHKCTTNCHAGPCEKPGQVCVQPCTVPRETCGHICGAPCHEGKCPDTPCKETVKVTCQCGHRSMSRVCAENAKDYHRIASGILASKMADMQLGHSVDLDEVFGQTAKKANQLKTLECNDECKIIERNRRMALGLQIVNPDVSSKLTPRYSDFMKQWAKKDPNFCQMVHDRLTELVQLAKTSKQKSRSYSFDSMNKDKRSFVHESCEHFGCQSQAYDQEPKRNVVATAVKDKCWLPSYSLLEVVQRENGLRKVPRPMLKNTITTSSSRNAKILPLNARKSKMPTPSTPVQVPSKSPEPEIDYFNFTGI